MDVSNIEDAITKTGWGFYSRFLIGYLGICMFSIRVATLGMPLYLPLIICDMPLYENAPYFINIGIPIGGIIGGMLCSLSDAIGRKPTLTFALLLCFISELSVSFSYNTLGMVVAQIVFGIGLTIGESLIRIQLAECLPISRRLKSLMVVEIFGAFGYCLAVVFSMFFLPLLRDFLKHNTRIITWRMIFCLPGLPVIIMACLSALPLESPRYLIYERRTPLALGILKEMFAINNSKLFFQYTVAERDLQGKIADFGINPERDAANNTKKFVYILRRMMKSTFALMRYFSEFAFILSFCRLFCILSQFPLSMLLIKTLNITEDFDIDSLDLLHFEVPSQPTCESSIFDYTYFWEFLVVQFAYMIGLVLSLAFISLIERKYLIFLGLLVSGLLTGFLAFIYSKYWIRFAISCIIMAAFGMVQACLNVITVECFPTAIRGTAAGNTIIISKFLEIILWMYLNMPNSWLFVTISFMMEAGAVLSFGLPKMKDRPMVD